MESNVPKKPTKKIQKEIVVETKVEEVTTEYQKLLVQQRQILLLELELQIS